MQFTDTLDFIHPLERKIAMGVGDVVRYAPPTKDPLTREKWWGEIVGYSTKASGTFHYVVKRYNDGVVLLVPPSDLRLDHRKPAKAPIPIMVPVKRKR